MIISFMLIINFHYIQTLNWVFIFFSDLFWRMFELLFVYTLKITDTEKLVAVFSEGTNHIWLDLQTLYKTCMLYSKQISLLLAHKSESSDIKKFNKTQNYYFH